MDPSQNPHVFHATTIVSVRRNGQVVIAGDGQVTLGHTVMKANALAHARGAFVGVLDGDDLLEPHALSTMLAHMRANPGLGMAYSQYMEIAEDGRVLGPGARFLIPYSRERLPVEFMTFQFRLIRADAYRAAGGYDPTIDESADYDLCLRLSEVCAIGHLPEMLFRYRIRRSSVSQSARLRQVRSSFEAAQRALKRRGLDRSHALSLGLRARHVLRPKPIAGLAATGSFDASDPEAEQCLRLSPPFDPASASPARGWVEQVEERYRAFVADAQHRGLDAKYECALEIDSWHILQSLRPFGGVGNWR